MLVAAGGAGSSFPVEDARKENRDAHGHRAASTITRLLCDMPISRRARPRQLPLGRVGVRDQVNYKVQLIGLSRRTTSSRRARTLSHPSRGYLLTGPPRRRPTHTFTVSGTATCSRRHEGGKTLLAPCIDCARAISERSRVSHPRDRAAEAARFAQPTLRLQGYCLSATRGPLVPLTATFPWSRFTAHL